MGRGGPLPPGDDSHLSHLPQGYEHSHRVHRSSGGGPHQGEETPVINRLINHFPPTHPFLIEAHLHVVRLGSG